MEAPVLSELAGHSRGELGVLLADVVCARFFSLIATITITAYLLVGLN